MSNDSSPKQRLPAWALPVVMGILSVALFADVLFVPGRVPAGAGSDLNGEYLYWRQFAVEQIRHGHFPLWNPYSFCGTPFFGDPQSAMLYPPNWLYLVLPLTWASSWLVAVHFFLAGWFAGIFCRLRGSSVAGAIVAAVVYACCGPIITNLRPGHLPLLFSAAWMPLVFCAVEAILSGRKSGLRWVLIGAAAVAMQAVDGYPQFAYYTALAAGVYLLIYLSGGQRKWRGVGGVAIMFISGWAIAAGQIVASISVSGESIRAGGLSYAAASAFSLPPVSLLTMIVPGLLGDDAHLMYYGPWYWWETSVFVGLGAVVLAGFGIRHRRGGSLALVAGIMFLLAVGATTPIFAALYRWLPGFSSFRAPTRFSLLGIFFLSTLAGLGLDEFRAASRRAVVMAAAGVLVAAAALGIALVWVMGAENDPSQFDRIVHTWPTVERLFSITPVFGAEAAAFAVSQLGTALVVAGAIGGVILFCSRRAALLALGGITIGQLVWFAAGQRTSSDGPQLMPSNWSAQIASLSSQERVLLCFGGLAESGAGNGFYNAGGSNPLVLARMARFLGAMTGEDAEEVGLNYPVRMMSPLYRILRCARIFPGHPGGASYPVAGALPRFLLLDHYTVDKDDGAALNAVFGEGFNPDSEVILESSPHIFSQSSSLPGSVHVDSETTDTVEVTADVPSPRVLLMTDAYSAGWSAVALAGSAQSEYRVMPGDYCLRAVPLGAGHHHFRLEYRPAGMAAGMWISIVALAGYAAAVVVCLRRSA